MLPHFQTCSVNTRGGTNASSFHGSVPASLHAGSSVRGRPGWRGDRHSQNCTANIGGNGGNRRQRSGAQCDAALQRQATRDLHILECGDGHTQLVADPQQQKATLGADDGDLANQLVCAPTIRPTREPPQWTATSVRDAHNARARPPRAQLTHTRQVAGATPQ